MAVSEYTVLIVEDRKDLVNLWTREMDLLSKKLKIPRFEAQSAGSFSEARKKCMEGCEPNLAIVDHHLDDKDGNGYDVCRFLLKAFPDVDILVNTGYSLTNVHEISGSPSEDEEKALKVFQLYYQLNKLYPQNNIIFTEKYGVGKQIIDRLRPIITKIIARDRVAIKLRTLILTRAPAMERCLKFLAFHSNDPILLLTGEKGAGKAYAAESLHKARRELNIASGSFMVVKSPTEKHILEQSARKGSTALLENISMFSDEEWLALAEVIDLFYDKGARRPSNSAMLVLTDLKVPVSFDHEEKAKEKIYGVLKNCTVNIPDLRDRPEDALILTRMFVTRFNADRGTEYMLTPTAEYHLKSTPFRGSVGELKTAVEGAFQIVRREGGTQISALHFSSVSDDVSPVSRKVLPDSSVLSEDAERQNLRGKIKRRLDIVKLVKSDLNQDKRLTTRMVDERMDKNSGGKAAVNFLNRYYREIANFIEGDFLAYQEIVSDLKRMCGKLAEELTKRGM